MNTFVICEGGGNLMHRDDDKFLFSLLRYMAKRYEWRKDGELGTLHTNSPFLFTTLLEIHT